MKKQFDGMYFDLEERLANLGHQAAGADYYLKGIELIREKIREMEQLGKASLDGRVAEVDYFRWVWPRFYGKLLFFIRLYRFDLRRQSLSEKAIQELIVREEKRIAHFFRANGEFWLYWRSGSPVLDEQFTREYSRALLLEPLALVIDSEGATLGSYKAAWCLAMESYKAWLEKEMEKAGGPGDLTHYWVTSTYW